MQIDSVKLRKELNKLHLEMGFVKMVEVKRVIAELEKEANRNAIEKLQTKIEAVSNN